MPSREAHLDLRREVSDPKTLCVMLGRDRFRPRPECPLTAGSLLRSWTTPEVGILLLRGGVSREPALLGTCTLGRPGDLCPREPSKLHTSSLYKSFYL